MILVAEALARILAGVALTGVEMVPLSAAAGRVLALPVLARVTQPPHDVSAMDGYAVGPGTEWTVIGTAPAGHPFAGSVGPGQAVRVFTGSVVPPGTIRVAVQEDATRDGDRLQVAPSTNRHIRAAGQDFVAGDAVLAAGQLLSPRAIGLAAAANYPWLAVRRRPRVAILATGDEVALPGEPIPPGGIVSSNAHSIAALVQLAGGEPVVLPIASDDAESLSVAISTLNADILVTCGGASVGTHDLVQPALLAAGFERSFWQVAMRPGKPSLFGHLRGMPVLGLPGNPVSAYVCAVLFLRPALAAMLGRDPVLPFVSRQLGAAMAANDHRQDYIRATRSGDVVTPAPRQDSSLLTVLVSAESLIVRAPNAPAAGVGASVLALDLDPY